MAHIWLHVQFIIHLIMWQFMMRSFLFRIVCHKIIKLKLMYNSDLVLDYSSPVDDNTVALSFIDKSLVSSAIASKCLWRTIDNSLGSDYLSIFIEYSRDTRAPSAPKLYVKRTDWVVFPRRFKLELVWENIDDKVNDNQNSILETALISIPKPSADSVKHWVPWWTPDCHRALCERKKTYRFFRNINNEN